MTEPESPYYTPEEARKVLRLGRNAMYDALKRGEVPGQKRFGRQYRILKSAIRDPQAA